MIVEILRTLPKIFQKHTLMMSSTLSIIAAASAAESRTCCFTLKDSVSSSSTMSLVVPSYMFEHHGGVAGGVHRAQFRHELGRVVANVLGREWRA